MSYLCSFLHIYHTKGTMWVLQHTLPLNTPRYGRHRSLGIERMSYRKWFRFWDMDSYICDLSSEGAQEKESEEAGRGRGRRQAEMWSQLSLLLPDPMGSSGEWNALQHWPALRQEMTFCAPREGGKVEGDPLWLVLLVKSNSLRTTDTHSRWGWEQSSGVKRIWAGCDSS